MEEIKVKNTIHLLLAVLAVCSLGLSDVWAGQLAVPHDASNGLANGRTADADQINENFAAVEAEVNDNDDRIVSLGAALPMMWASTDEETNGVSMPADSGSVETNSVSITAPTGGFLIISGNLFINNQSFDSETFYLSPYVDGADIFPGYSFAVAADAQPDDEDGEFISLAYTVTVPITAGSHTVSQEVLAYFNEDAFFYNRNNLTVLFVPASQGTYTPAQ
jgi:hypothetical protein